MIATTIAIAEDHTLVRAGIRALLEKIEGVTVLGEASDGLDAVRLCTKQQPDVMLMDISMPGLNGLDATQKILDERPETRVLMLSMYANETYMHRALEAGAAGYLLKGATTDEFKQAIEIVRRGETYVTPSMTKHLVERIRRNLEHASSPLAKLSSRQREILQLLAEGQTTKDMAARLAISVRTVETHRAQLMQRLDIHDLAGLVRLAIKEGLVQAEA